MNKKYSLNELYCIKKIKIKISFNYYVSITCAPLSKRIL